VLPIYRGILWRYIRKFEFLRNRDDDTIYLLYIKRVTYHYTAIITSTLFVTVRYIYRGSHVQGVELLFSDLRLANDLRLDDTYN